MSLKRLALYLGAAFLVVFIVQSPGEAAKVVQAAGENASEWFSVASTAFAKFLKSLVQVAYSRYLAPGERIVIEIHHHLMVLLRPFVVALGVIFGAMVLGFLLSPDEGADAVDTVLGLVAVVFLFRFLWRVWEWRVDKIIVTDRRILEVSGLLTRKVASMPLEKLTDLTYNRSLAGRVFGYGRISVESAGQEQGLTTIDYLPSPDDFYRTVTSLVTGVMPKPDPEIVHEASWDDEDTGPLPPVVV